MKVYIAAPFICQSITKLRALELTKMGIHVTSRWLNEDPHAEQTPEYQASRADIDIDDILAADYFILLAEHDSRTGGKHFETGFAYAAKKNILIVGRRENVFHWLHGIMFDETWEKAIKRIHRTLEAVTDFVSQ